MKKHAIFFACILACNFNLIAQPGKLLHAFNVGPEDFQLPAISLIDSNTKAVVLSDIGSVTFTGRKRTEWTADMGATTQMDRNWFSYVYKKHTRIRIIKKAGLDELGTIVIPVFGSGKSQDRIDSLQVSTFNFENGKVIETDITLDEGFEDRIGKNLVLKKFAISGIKDGSIIEYSYVKATMFWANLPTWEFQNEDGPCLYSEFQVTIPASLAYSTIRHGIDPFSINETSTLKGQLYRMPYMNVTVDAIKHRWAMKNMPQYKREDFVNTPENYINKLEFYLTQYSNGSDVFDVSTNWNSLNAGLMQDNYFGEAISSEGGSFLSDYVNKITMKDKTADEQIRSIFNHVKSTYTSTKSYDVRIQQSLMSVYNKKKGTSAEINLLLIAMLRQKNISADPVILGTRELGPTPSKYPVMDKLNYVIAAVGLPSDTLLLDASNPDVPFGHIPLDCYNGYARIISERNSGPILLYPDKIKDQKMTTVFISNAPNKKMTGTFEYNPGYYGSQVIRNEVKKSTFAKFFENLAGLSGVDVSRNTEEIDSLSKPDFPVRVYYEFSLNPEDKSGHMYFNPFLGENDLANKFKSEQRKFPVELPYPTDEMYVLNLEIPEGYTIDELPKPSKVAYNGNEGYYEYMIAHDDNNVQLKSHLKLNRATYSPEEYKALREFFGYVVNKQSEQIVFKKK